MNTQRIDGPNIRHDQEAASGGVVGYYWTPPRKAMTDELVASYAKKYGSVVGTESDFRSIARQMREDKLRDAWLSIGPAYIPEPAPPPRA